jgi:hypothetical protein
MRIAHIKIHSTLFERGESSLPFRTPHFSLHSSTWGNYACLPEIWDSLLKFACTAVVLWSLGFQIPALSSAEVRANRVQYTACV